MARAFRAGYSSPVLHLLSENITWKNLSEGPDAPSFLLTLEKQHRKCTSCGACRRCCPVEVGGVYWEKEKTLVTDSECMLA